MINFFLVLDLCNLFIQEEDEKNVIVVYLNFCSIFIIICFESENEDVIIYICFIEGRLVKEVMLK